jgi:pimeloyl-ACP methyl ester carboxylesterase
MIGRAAAVAAFVTLVVGGALAAEPRTACAKATDCREDVLLGPGVLFPVYSSFRLDKADPEIRHALFILHGTHRDANGYFETGISGAQKSGRLDDTLVVAPYFTTVNDVKNRPKGELYWSRNDDWKEGGASSKKLASPMSSFAVMDALVRRLGDRSLFPNLQSIVIAGHSAGGQFVQRYAAGQPPGLLADGITLRFVIANPSTYMYFDKDRPLKDGGFGTPNSACAFNNYKYGLDGRNDYMGKVDGPTLLQRYREREVVYLLGQKDINPKDADLDVSCPAMAQGRFRLERGRAFVAYMKEFHPADRHRLEEVPDAGHNRNRMFLSKTGLAALYD